MKKICLYAAITVVASGVAFGASAVAVPVPNGDFESTPASEFAVPVDWQEDQPRVVGSAGFANSGTSTGSGGLTPAEGTRMGRVAMIGDADSGTDFSGTISTTGNLGQFEVATEYTMTFQAARDSFVGTNQWFVLGGIRANGVDVADVDVDIRSLTDGNTTGAEDTFYPVTVTFSTLTNPLVVGDDISLFVGFRHDDNFNKTIFFDDVQLEKNVIPEPASVGALLSGTLVALRRRRA